MNNLLADYGLASWKPIPSALLLPPVPFLLLILVGARLLLPRRGWGWAVVLLGVAGIWLGGCNGTARWLEYAVLKVPAALSADGLGALKAEARQNKQGGTAIVVLGSGVEPFAPEYGVSSLAAASLERLRYGVWLGRETGLPVAFSGGIGWGGTQGGASEAEVAARIAAQEFGRPLRWVEADSRDTRENAARSVGLLQRAGVGHVVLVTHGWHMPRARRAFQQAVAALAPGMQIDVAPMGLAARVERSDLDWVPTTRGITDVRNDVREALGWVMGS